MKASTETWLHEVSTDLDEVKQGFTKAGFMTGGNCERLFKAYEKTVKAPVVEKFGSVPRRFRTHELSTLCQSYGLWPILPAKLKAAITGIEPFYPVYPNELGYITIISSSSVAEWGNRITVAIELLDHIEKNVICDSVAFSRLIF
jgi:hypothetical protein